MAPEHPIDQSPSERRGPGGKFLPGHAVGSGTRFQPGNSASVRSGIYRARLRAGEIPPELLADMMGFREAVVTDLGGPEALTEIQRGLVGRLVELETFSRLLVADIQAHGIVGKSGRERSSYRNYLATIDRWDRIAQRLGADRRAKNLTPSTPAEWLEQRAHSSQEHDQ